MKVALDEKRPGPAHPSNGLPSVHPFCEVSAETHTHIPPILWTEHKHYPIISDMPSAAISAEDDPCVTCPGLSIHVDAQPSGMLGLLC